jgi:hypothetical protein
MGERSTANLDQVGDAGGSGGREPAVETRPPAPPVRRDPPPVQVELNYPEPTLLSVVIRDVARWSRLSFVMEPTVNTKIQIFAPRRMAPSEAYDLFLASLAVVNLRAVQMGQVVKIVPVTIAVSA